jgi:hypothetical protein
MDVLQINLSGSVLKLVENFHQTWDKEHSLNYTIEDCLVAGVEAKRRSKEYSEATNNRKKFEKEIATDPSIILNPSKMLDLMKKYKIGSSNSKLEDQVLEAATAMTKAAAASEASTATAPATGTNG